MSVAIEIVDDPARACAAMLVSAALAGGDIVLTGGSTPKAAYAEFVRTVQEVGLDLSRKTFWLSDERCVEPDDDRCNFKMIRGSLLDPLDEPARPRVRRIRGELGPERGAQEYERELREAGPPEFGLVLLGVGPDGHIASLFPGQSTLQERERLVVGVPDAGFQPLVSRISLTLPALTSARQIVILVAGESKAEAVGEAFGPHAEPDPHVPASLLAPEAKLITVISDRAAAARLGTGGSA